MRKMATKTSVHNNKNMILYFTDSRQKVQIPSEIDDKLVANEIDKRPWSNHLLAYIVSFKKPITDKDVEEITMLTKNSGWVFRQERDELAEDYR